MKFIIEPQHGIKQDTVIVWDAKKGQELCIFNGGELETEDEYIIERLAELGYGSEQSEPDNGEPEKVIPLTDDDAVIESALRAKAKSLGIKHSHMKSIETLTAEIAEKEGTNEL